MLHETHQSIKQQESHLLTATGKMLAQNEEIKALLRKNHPKTEITKYSNQIAAIYHLDYVVVMNMSGIRLTHPMPEKIGKPFEGGDEKDVLQGKEVLSTAKGSLGKSLRYLVPVFDGKKQIGALAVGIKLTTLNEVALTSKRNYTLSLLFCLLISLLGTSLLSIRLKRQLHNLEPSEIYQLLEERNAMLDQMEAAVFVINKTGKLQLCNQAAKELIEKNVQKVDRFGQAFHQLFPQFAQLDFQREHEQLFRYQEEDYLLSVSPITVKNDHRGYIIFMREAAKAIDTLDQLAYTTAYASALQAQTHKFMNQLHVIYGLVDIAYYDQLKIYLNSLLEAENETITSLSVLVKEPLLASFLIGEQEKCQELNMTLKIDINSEIPHSITKNQLNNCLMLYRFIHSTILNNIKPIAFTIQLKHDNHFLTSHYQLNLPSPHPNHFQEAFEHPYFKQLLKDTKADFHHMISDSKLELILRTPYIGD